MARVYLSLGSNQAPEKHLSAALAALRERFGALSESPVYRTPAVGFEGPDFLNLAVGLNTDMPVLVLNDWLRALEDHHGRRRDVPRFSSRTLDIDIVLYDDQVMRGPGNLELPRGELVKHAFVLKPMVDIAPNLIHPMLGRSLADLWRAHPERDAELRPAALTAPD